MTAVTIIINDTPVTDDVEPRMHLADFIREVQNLTGTHVGCEHGVCGACTVEIDGEIARSCITFAAACHGARVRTIEGFDDDPLMDRLRRAFSAEHALQCGYCTPGMMIAARDLIRRRGAIDEAEIRREMSGNLCRCTGYAGIVRAVARVMAESPSAGAEARAVGTWLGPSPGPALAELKIAAAPPTEIPGIETTTVSRTRRHIDVTTTVLDPRDGLQRLAQSFLLAHPIADVWRLVSDPAAIVACVPGASLTAFDAASGRLTGNVAVGLGPIRASFSGNGTFTPHEPTHECRLSGRGQEVAGASRATAEVIYRLDEIDSETTRVVAEIGYTLSGPLAQFARPGMVRSLVASLGQTFASNIEARLSGSPTATEPLSLFVLLRRFIAALWQRKPV